MPTCRKSIMLAFAVAATLAVPPYSYSAEPLENRSVPKAGFVESRFERIQKEAAGLPAGERIAVIADAFVGTPYDTDPLGRYVRTEKIVCDSEIDCMYMVFRAVELATSDSLEGAEGRALELRFATKGVVEDGRVVNYGERYQYAEDMIASGKWGEDVTATLGRTEAVKGERGRDVITYIPARTLAAPDGLSRLMDGDIVFFVKDPERRVVGEVIGHLGIVKVEDGVPMLIHASGTKESKDRPGGGETKKVSLHTYLMDTKFIGGQVTRFGE